MKKQPVQPDINENAPRPRHVSSDDADIPTMDTPPNSPSGTATGFDRAADAMDQAYRSGLLPGSDDTLSPEDPSSLEDDIDLAQGVDPEPYAEFWAERESFPQQDDPDQEEPFNQVSGLSDESSPGSGMDDSADDSRKESNVEKAGAVAPPPRKPDER